MNATPGNKPGPRLPRHRQATAAADGRSIGCLLPSVLIVLLLGAGGYFACQKFNIDRSKLLDKLGPRRHPDVEIIDPSLHLDERKEVAPPEPTVTNVVEKPAAPPPPPQKTAAEMKAEADAAQKALDGEIAAARRQSGKSLSSFAGIRFGDEMKGPVISLGPIPHAAETTADGVCYQMFGPKLSSAFRQFGKQPLVYVTPLTRKIFRIEFSRAIERRPGWRLNPETTNLVETLSSKIARQPFALDVAKYPLARHEFVFPIGETTLTAGEYGGVQLKLVAEHAGFRALALEESAGYRTNALARSPSTKTLSSDAYPNSGIVKFGRAKMKNGTPKAFCGIVFGSLPPHSARVSTPASSTDPTCFFIDYRKSKCKPFMNFDHGKAELSEINGAVVAVRLFSNGPDDGLTPEEHFAQARQAIERRFKAKPASAKGEGTLQELTYAVGSLEITLGPDPAGGLRLSAVNTALKELW